jgi:hypothetical protein
MGEEAQDAAWRSHPAFRDATEPIFSAAVHWHCCDAYSDTEPGSKFYNKLIVPRDI